MADKRTTPAPNSHVDPICGKRLASDRPGTRVSEYKRRRYHFCSEDCQRAFLKQTERFRMQELARAGALLTPGGVRWALA